MLVKCLIEHFTIFLFSLPNSIYEPIHALYSNYAPGYESAGEINLYSSMLEFEGNGEVT